MTYRRPVRRRAQKPPEVLPSQRSGGSPVGTWLSNGTDAAPSGVIWLKRPMPDGQWPPDPSAPRDDSFRWWVRSHCGHQGGAKQWAFYEESYADVYERVFRDNPCHYTRCQDHKRRGR